MDRAGFVCVGIGGCVNPWNLLPSETRMLDALIQHGCDKGVARALGIVPRTVTAGMWRIRGKMNATSRIQAVVLWDRFKRGEHAA
jgi:FixJ family two-component response regulator